MQLKYSRSLSFEIIIICILYGFQLVLMSYLSFVIPNNSASIRMSGNVNEIKNGHSTQVYVDNPHLKEMCVDHLYHIGMTNQDSLAEKFGDVKFICMGGKSQRMKKFAETMYEALGHPKNSVLKEAGKKDSDCQLKDLAGHAGRYSLYKVGPVLSASHGIGPASMSVILHELLKLVHYAGCKDITIIRIGTSGGLGLEPGTVVVTERGYNGLLEPFYRQVSCGKEIKYDTKTTVTVAKKLCECSKSINVNAVLGNTLCANDFYEEQGRLDGALCSYTAEDRMNFLHSAYNQHGVRNMEMESACFAAICNRAKVKCAVICVCLVNRFDGDGLTTDLEDLKKWESYPQKIAEEFIKRNI